MQRKTVHVIPNSNNDGWNVKKGSARRVSISTERKADAVKIGRLISQRSGSELIIHGQNGKIQQFDSYWDEHCPPKDKNRGINS